MSGSIFTPAQMADYGRDGFVLVPGLFDADEIALLRAAIETDPALDGADVLQRGAQRPVP